MKRTWVLALLLVLVCSLFVSAENLALGKKYVVNIPPETSYPDNNYELTNGKGAGASIYDGGWAGYLRQEYRIFVIDLEATYEIDGVTVTALQDTTTGVGLPDWICFSVSTDGRRWRAVDVIEIYDEDRPSGIAKYTYVSNPGTVKARYVAVKVHVGTWAFIDEITVEGNPATKEDVAVSFTLNDIDFEEIEFDY